MGNNELQKIWKTVDSKIEPKSENELRLILESKIRKVMNKFYILNIGTLLITAGFFIFLTVSLIN
ncbi:MAG: hypothetical protein ACOCWA_05795, partial [Bacteroidota bacterium]